MLPAVLGISRARLCADPPPKKKKKEKKNSLNVATISNQEHQKRGHLTA